MLSTCKRNPTKKEYALCLSSFEKLFKQTLENGHVPDDVFESLGFPMDKDMNGIKVQTATVAQESRQRVKTLTHNAQMN